MNVEEKTSGMKGSFEYTRSGLLWGDGDHPASAMNTMKGPAKPIK
jgi:hypothetical protein